MKHIKLFAEPDIKVGDYVIMNIDNLSYVGDYKIFVKTHIAKVENIRISQSRPSNIKLCIIYIKFILNDNESSNFNLESGFVLDAVKYSAPTIEELKLKINSEKYNI